MIIFFLRPVAWIAALTRGSSHAFTVERSMISKSGGSTSASSGIVAPAYSGPLWWSPPVAA